MRMLSQVASIPVVAVFKPCGRRHSCLCGSDLFQYSGSLQYGGCGPFLIDCVKCGNQYDSAYVLEVVGSRYEKDCTG